MDGEKFSDFVTELKKLAASCNFGNLKDSLIHSRIISGVQDKKLMEFLLKQDDLNLTKTISICKTAELASLQLKLINSNVENVGAVTQKRKSEVKPEYQERVCGYCGNVHTKGKCPAYGRTCNKCYGKNHFSQVCKNTNYTKNNIRKVSAVEDAEKPQYSLGNINASEPNNWYENFKVGTKFEKNLKLKIDTGAQCNVISIYTYRDLGFNEKLIQDSRAILTNYSGSKIEVAGQCVLECLFKNKIHLLKFQVVNCKSPPILGLRSINGLNLICRIDNIENEFLEILDNFSDMFGSMGLIKDYEYQIRLKKIMLE